MLVISAALDLDFNIAAERAHEAEQPLKGEALEAPRAADWKEVAGSSSALRALAGTAIAARQRARASFARAKMPFPIHPHMLRHGCGYALANAGHDTRRLQAYLGHKNIQHTVRYTDGRPKRKTPPRLCHRRGSRRPTDFSLSSARSCPSTLDKCSGIVPRRRQ